MYFDLHPGKSCIWKYSLKIAPLIMFTCAPPLEVRQHCTGDSESNLAGCLAEEILPSIPPRVQGHPNELLLGKTIGGDVSQPKKQLNFLPTGK